MLNILLILAGVLLLVQVVLAITALLALRKLEQSYSLPLGSRTSVSSLLETYSRVVNPINIRVNARIKDPAAAYNDLVLVNQRYVYRKDLYSTCITLWQVRLALPQHQYLQQLTKWQAVAFIAQLVILIAGMFFQNELLVVISLLLGFCVFISSYFFQSKFRDFTYDYVQLAADLLNLDNVEQARVISLSSKMAEETFTYPTAPLRWLIAFINPF